MPGRLTGGLPIGQYRDVELQRARLGDDSVRPLLAALVEEYRSRFGSGHDLAIADIEVFDPPADDFDPSGGMFLVLVEDGQTLSGGGFRRLSADTCEVRRMWTAPACRRRGLASSILDALESAALCQGYRRVRLETAPGQVEALSLHRDRGYHEIPVYGRFEVALAFERELRTD